jgi:hypothetical protein
MRDVLRERDDITTSLVLTTLADPHEEARRGEAAEHFLHLSNALQHVTQLLRDIPRIGFIRVVIAMIFALEKEDQVVSMARKRTMCM